MIIHHEQILAGRLLPALYREACHKIEREGLMVSPLSNIDLDGLTFEVLSMPRNGVTERHFTGIVNQPTAKAIKQHYLRRKVE